MAACRKEMLEHKCEMYPFGIAVSASTILRFAPWLMRQVQLRMETAKTDSGNGDAENDVELDNLVMGYLETVAQVLDTAQKRKDMTDAEKSVQDEMQEMAELQRDQAMRAMDPDTDGLRKKRATPKKRKAFVRDDDGIDLSSDAEPDDKDDDDGVMCGMMKMLSDQASNDREDKAAARAHEKDRLKLDDAKEARLLKETEARLNRDEKRDEASMEQQKVLLGMMQKTMATSMKDQLLAIKELYDGELITADEAAAQRLKILAASA